MALSTEQKKAIKESVKPIVMAAATAALMGAAGAVIAKLSVTNYKKSGLTGDTEMKPTKDEVAVSEVNTSAANTDASLAADKVSGMDGSLSGVKTKGAATTGEATALESGAVGARTKAGSADIELKALKMT